VKLKLRLLFVIGLTAFACLGTRREQYIWVREAGNFQAVLAQRDDNATTPLSSMR
jgi:hypothetical protein